MASSLNAHGLHLICSVLGSPGGVCFLRRTSTSPRTLSAVQSALEARDVAYKLKNKCLSQSNHYWWRRNRKHINPMNVRKGESGKPMAVLAVTLHRCCPPHWNFFRMTEKVSTLLDYLLSIHFAWESSAKGLLSTCRVSACRLLSFSVGSSLRLDGSGHRNRALGHEANHLACRSPLPCADGHLISS